MTLLFRLELEKFSPLFLNFSQPVSLFFSLFLFPLSPFKLSLLFPISFPSIISLTLYLSLYPTRHLKFCLLIVCTSECRIKSANSGNVEGEIGESGRDTQVFAGVRSIDRRVVVDVAETRFAVRNRAAMLWLLDRQACYHRVPACETYHFARPRVMATRA